jgi:uncharacterized protein
MRIHLTIAAAALITTAFAAHPAAAFSCAVPAIASAVKRTVCAEPLLMAIDRTEAETVAGLGGRLSGDARRAVLRDRRAFHAVRDNCGADVRCLEASYRAQVRLYRKLESCLRPDARELFCVTRTIEQHRQELHRSM